MKSFKRRWVILSACLMMAGCIYNDVREVEPNQAFHGLSHVYQSGGSTLNVVFVHGMGHHPFGEPDLLTYQLKIAEKLGFEASTIHVGVDWGGHCQPLTQAFVDSGYGYFTEEEKDRLRARLDGGQAICVLKINDVVVGFLGWQQFLIPDNGKTLNLFELSWDRATERLQKTLLELDEDYKETVELDDNLEPVEGGRDRESDRAGINSLLKRFVNQNLGDPAIYLGAYGDAIRRVVAEGLSTIAASAGPNGEHEYSIVSDSLGSRVVFDTLGCAVDSGHGKPARGCEYLRDEKRLVAETKAALSAVASQTTKVFMNANQLPFLALSNVRPPARNETEVTWLNRFPCEGGGPGLVRALVITKALETPVQIVAFTDPNDALSYHLTERFRKKCTHLDLDAERSVDFINVRIANVKWTFGIFANPNKAHSGGFRMNTNAINLLVDGYQPEQASPQ